MPKITKPNYLKILLYHPVLIQYSNKKTNFRRIKLIIDLKNWHKNHKMLFFESIQSKGFTKCQKILQGCSFGFKSLLTFTCLTIKFHNFHHATLDPSFCFCVRALAKAFFFYYAHILYVSHPDFKWSSSITKRSDWFRLVYGRRVGNNSCLFPNCNERRSVG